MNRSSKFYRGLQKLTVAIGKANVGYIFNISGVKPQTDYNPVNPAEDEIRPLDSSPDAVRKREKAARNSLMIPLAVILSVVIFFAIVVLVYR